MRLLVLSDLHLEFSELEVPANIDFDVAILAGDIIAPGSNAIEWSRRPSTLGRAGNIVLVPGNHEYYRRVMHDELSLMRAAAQGTTNPALHVLDCNDVVIDGVRFLGCTLWTDFELRIDTPKGPISDRNRGIEASRKAMKDYKAIDVPASAKSPSPSPTRKLTAEDTLALHRVHRAWLEEALAQPFDGPTVVVTHHCPHRNSLAPRFAADWASTAFISELPASFFEVPVLWIHGHTHVSFDYHVGRCRVVCNPRGYQIGRMQRPENERFNPGLVIDIE